jgi:hypothetical protein
MIYCIASKVLNHYVSIDNIYIDVQYFWLVRLQSVQFKPERNKNVTQSKQSVEKAKITGFTPDNKIAFASSDTYGTVTFKLSTDSWMGENLPQIGEIVILSKLTRFKKGWRTMTARPFVLADETNDSDNSETDMHERNSNV